MIWFVMNIGQYRTRLRALESEMKATIEVNEKKKKVVIYSINQNERGSNKRKMATILSEIRNKLQNEWTEITKSGLTRAVITAGGQG